MIGLVIVTHGRLAQEFVAALEHIVGKQNQIAAISIGPEDDPELRRREILEAAQATDDGSGVVILTDMFGGTPSNLAIAAMARGRIEVIAGVNLPMLVKLAEVRESKTLDRAVFDAQDAARKYVAIASAQLAS